MLKLFVHFYDTGIKPVALHMLLRLVTSELSPGLLRSLYPDTSEFAPAVWQCMVLAKVSKEKHLWRVLFHYEL